MPTEHFKLLGLNKKRRTGIYATVEFGKEDWFHSDFDPTIFPIIEQYQLFDYMKNGDEKFAGHTVFVSFDHYTNGVPINPIIKECSIKIPKSWVIKQ